MSKSDKTTESQPKKMNGLVILFALLIIWTLIIAVGLIQTQASTDLRRPLILIACMAVFLGGWLSALQAKRKR